MVINFQSWADPFIIITLYPLACWYCVDVVCHSYPVSVPALTGAIMTMGVATANSILLLVLPVIFATESDPTDCRFEAGFVRLGQ